ncbi:MAG TPA: TIGR03668 family PPOX class F420-dependent oxidoreductase [Candidatus Limnocylindrales bacterium]|nr:TIGR03668 family PPOX class F420-dependent oxidoreductase [Candidatus Limnocylindrales bacterium]
MPADPILSTDQRHFLASARSATLATTAPDGRPRLVPICFVLGADDDDGRPCLYSPLDEKPKRIADPHDLARVQDLLVLPEASLLVDRWSEDWSRLGWLRLHGRGVLLEPEPHEIAEHAAAIADLRLKYEQYLAQDLQHRPLIRLTIHRAHSWGDLSQD